MEQGCASGDIRVAKGIRHRAGLARGRFCLRAMLGLEERRAEQKETIGDLTGVAGLAGVGQRALRRLDGAFTAARLDECLGKQKLEGATPAEGKRVGAVE